MLILFLYYMYNKLDRKKYIFNKYNNKLLYNKLNIIISFYMPASFHFLYIILKSYMEF